MAGCARRNAVLLLLLLSSSCVRQPEVTPEFFEIPAEGLPEFFEIPAGGLHDKIRGGLLAQLLGNLNGLKHEHRYIDEPGNVERYVPALPTGARTDDDTDIEWVYVSAMQQAGELFLPPDRIVSLWKSHINQRIWSSNQYVRQLMDLGIEPPMTGNRALNPWAEFNISGQFLAESFGLLAPAMPQTAARIGLHYTRVGIDGEPAQTTQMFNTMIATAFTTDDLDHILKAGFDALDRKSEIRGIVENIRQWHGQNPENWRETRRLIKEEYTRYGGGARDGNGYDLNTAATVASLLYGNGDFVETLIHSFNFGWDADNNAATAATIIGVIQGERWMQMQGWNIVDRYQNTTRPGLPSDETITSFGDRLIGLADLAIVKQGGQKTTNGSETTYRIRRQEPANVEPLIDPLAELAGLRQELGSEIERDLLGGNEQVVTARAAYLAICLDLAEGFRETHAAQWEKALSSLEQYQNVLQALFFKSANPKGQELRAKATAVGLAGPEKEQAIWSFIPVAEESKDLGNGNEPLCLQARRHGDGVFLAFEEADIDGMISHTAALSRTVPRLLKSWGTARSKIEAIATEVATNDWDRVDRSAAELRQIIQVLHPIRRSKESGSKPSDLLCFQLDGRLHALERAVAAREAKLAAKHAADLKEAAGALQKAALELTRTAKKLTEGLDLGSRQQVTEASRDLQGTLLRFHGLPGN